MPETLQATICPRCWGRQVEPGGVAPCLLCGARGHIENTLLSEHFRLGELLATRHQEFANDPDANQAENLSRLCRELLEPVRAVVGPLRVSSGFRSRLLDAHVAGPEWATSKLSAHAIGAAADVVPLAAGMTPKDVIEAVRTIPGLAWDQAILEGNGCAHLGLLAPRGTIPHRRQVSVRVRCVVDAGFAYEVYTGTPEQLARVA